VTDEQPQIEQGSGEQYDAPNQQAVGQDPPWVEGTGGEAGEVQPTNEQNEDTDEDEEDEGSANLDAMTKAQLLDHAHELGVDVDESATKAELRAVIDQAEGR
jgi:hypothetical protein